MLPPENLTNLDWTAWEAVIERSGITIDRPKGSTHPLHSDIRYPIDYGFINGTEGSDGEEIDIFVGTALNGIVAAIFTTDFRKGDRECKFLYRCSPEEIYLVNGFINYDQALMIGKLLMRSPMRNLWSEGC
jgi:inorganic pyrophosphatase